MDELRALSEAATPGPWAEGLNGNPVYPRFDSGRTETVYPVATAVGSVEEWTEAIWVLRRQKDAAFIVAAVNYVREILASTPKPSATTAPPSDSPSTTPSETATSPATRRSSRTHRGCTRPNAATSPPEK